MIELRPKVFMALVAMSLLIAALRLFLPETNRTLRHPPLVVALLVGCALGLLSGLVGVGGGIFLTPLLLLAGWANPKEAAAVSAPFILVNSLAGLAGLSMKSMVDLPSGFPVWVMGAILGGLLGSQWGSRQWRPAWLRPALGVVLLIATAKFSLQIFS
jgi:uncharacterized membrane protein YfcA